MIMKLKTLKQIKDEYNHHYSDGDIFFENNAIFYNVRCINRPMFYMFGKEHEVIKSEVGNLYIIYDIIHDMYWHFHKDWFVSKDLVDFIDDDEFTIE